MEIQSELACNQIISTKQRLPMKRTPKAMHTEYGTTERPGRLRLRSDRLSVFNPFWGGGEGCRLSDRHPPPPMAIVRFVKF
jgi:hypothetical protein